MYKSNEMEECDGGEARSKTTGYGPMDLQNLFKNKHLGGKRTSPQEQSDQRQQVKNKEIKMFKCPQCDFITQNEIFFNDHMTKVHAGQPNCPFCFVAFENYPSLRKHCEDNHGERSSDKKKETVPEGKKENIPEGRSENDPVDRKANPSGRKGPCRFFNNGQGQCSPRFGTCQYDHSVIPDSERELCFPKQSCTYKPYCIFLHPEGQGEDVWQQNMRKVARVCRFTQNGNTCMRSYCTFYHPISLNTSSFHWDHASKPPLKETDERMTSTKNIPIIPIRIPVIVKNNLKSRKEFPELSQSLKGMSLD